MEASVAMVDNHDDDSVEIVNLDVEETNMRRCGLLSNKPEDADQPGHRTEAERSLSPRRQTGRAPAMTEVAERNQRCCRR